jgi:hypothetical protein
MLNKLENQSPMLACQKAYKSHVNVVVLPRRHDCRLGEGEEEEKL